MAELGREVATCKGKLSGQGKREDELPQLQGQVHSLCTLRVPQRQRPSVQLLPLLYRKVLHEEGCLTQRAAGMRRAVQRRLQQRAQAGTGGRHLQAGGKRAGTVGW